MRLVAVIAFSLVFFQSAATAETKIKMEDLPPAVRKAVKELTSHRTLVGLAAETENGQPMYEVETTVNGRSHDFLLDKAGTVIETEEEVDLESVPATAKKALQRKAAGGKINKVESITRGAVTSYEAEIVRNGKTAEVAVNADGSNR